MLNKINIKFEIKMNSVQKKLDDLEKLKKEMSEKLDKYEYSFHKSKEKVDLPILKEGKQENNNNNNMMGKNYKQIMDQRLNEIMGKIDDHIINQNYTNFYKFLSKASPYQKIQTKSNVQNTENNNKISEPKEKESSEENYDDFNNDEEINKIENEIPKENRNNKENANEEINNNQKVNEIKNEFKEIDKNKIRSNKKTTDIHISYNGGGKIDLEELKSKQNLELLHKQQNIFLSNELTVLKCKLNKIRKDNEFLQSVINEKGMVKNTNVLEKFIGKFVERLSSNWDEIVNMIIDEMLIDEAYELNEIDLKKINYEKNKNKLIKNLVEAGFGGILPENDENNLNDLNTNMDLIVENLDFIQKMLNNVKQNEKDMKIKYNIK